jgi:putative two-component system response regulator
MNSGIRILLVDQNKTNLMVWRQILDQSYEVLLSYSASHAIEIISNCDIDMVISDSNLPDMDAFKFFSAVRTNLRFGLHPFIFMGDFFDPKLEEDCYKIGIDDFISKSSTMSSISHRVSRAIELYQHRTSMMQNSMLKDQKIELIQQQIIQAFSSIIEGRDTSTGMHIKRTASYVEMVVNGLYKKGYYRDQLPEDVCESIVKAAPLHDIGKITVSDTILCKPGKLTIAEFEIMKTHAAVGGKLITETLGDIESSLMLSTAVDMATFHHERWGGGGYPYNLCGSQIPLSARVMAIADVFDALVSKRCYKDSFSYDDSFDIISQESGTHFDPKIVEVFMEMRDDIASISESWSL